MSLTKFKLFLARLLPSGHFARGVTVLASGTAAAQMIGILSSPILTRLYSPDDFGVLAVFSSLLVIGTVISGLRYEMVVPLTRTDGAAVNLLALSTLSVFVFTALLTVIVALFSHDLAVITKIPLECLPLFWALPLAVALGGLFQAFNLWAVRNKAFGEVVRTRLQQSIGMVGVQIATGLCQFGPLGLIVGQIVGQSAGLALLVKRFLNDKPRFMSQIKPSRLKKFAIRYYKFPLFDTSAALGNTASVQIPPLLFAALYNPAVAGAYMVANRVMNLPMTLIAQSIGQVFFAQASEAHRQGNLQGLTWNTFRVLTRIIVTPLILFACVSPDIFAVCFGEHWRVAGVYAAWISFWIIMQFIYSPLSVLLIVTEHPQENLYMQVILFVTRLTAVLAAHNWGDEVTAVIAYSVSSALVYGGGIFWVTCRYGEISSYNVLATLGSEIWWACLLLLPFLMIKNVYPLQLSSTAGELLAFAAIGVSTLVWIAFRGFPTLKLIRDKR